MGVCDNCRAGGGQGDVGTLEVGDPRGKGVCRRMEGDRGPAPSHEDISFLPQETGKLPSFADRSSL